MRRRVLTERWGSVYEDKEKREFLEDMARGKTMSGFNTRFEDL